MCAKKLGVPVTMRALLQRLNRKLGAEGEVVKAARGEKARQEMGDFFHLDVDRNAIIATDVDPEQLGRKLGVLHPWERIED